MEKILLGYVLVLNIYAFLLAGIDKRKAQRGQWRIPEARLWESAWFGGAVGLWIGMQVFHHKTKHRLFVIGVPLLCFFNMAAYSFLVYWLLF